MSSAAKPRLTESPYKKTTDLSKFVPAELKQLSNTQTAIPRLARDEKAVSAIEEAVQRIPTSHQLYRGDARTMSGLKPESVHLVLTSPPYWTLKEYRASDDQLGHVEDYDQFLQELDKVWKQCFSALVPGGRLVCVVGGFSPQRDE
jgi:hypothetical protein